MTVLVPNTICTSFRAELGQALHNETTTTGNQFFLALIRNNISGTYNASVFNYGSGAANVPSSGNLGNDELPTGPGYVTGGFALSLTSIANNVTPVANGTQGCWTWLVNPNFPGLTGSVIGAEIYNKTNSGRTTSLYDLTAGTGTAVSLTSGTLTLVLPAQTAGNAIIQI